MNDKVRNINNDEAGLSNNQVANPLDKLYSWLYEIIRPALKGNVLEVDSGNGYFSALMVADGFKVILVDSDPHHCHFLQNKFEKQPLVRRIHNLDLSKTWFEIQPAKIVGKIDTVVSITMPDKNDATPVRLRTFNDLLDDRGRLIVVLPARNAPFANLDSDNSTWWKCNKWKIRELIGNQNEVLSFRSFSTSSSEKLPDAKDLKPEPIPYFHLPFQSTSYETGTYMIVIARILKSKITNKPI